ncbi:(4Fe-4S)-binding protein [Clostridium sp. 1001270J_160509_D11]|jgi:dissimilatory sulfite reductase (desulfoviridin) alpha/beta subunit|uniref:(4Fe-4S)-binding protein n=1 Tax=Clostridium sp. 1001270J_160509_D11 TaxID=2787103 RepID=UPI0018AAA07A|nr:(4Fe-4S)-binding protein [Clostridium sp. 1001270J_160509_D11]
MSSLTISPEEEKRVKGLGFLNNKGTDNFSARVLTVNGKITAAQHRCIAEAAELFGNGNITFTTRLSIEVQGIPFDKIDDFRNYIAKEGLKTGGTGAKIRPIVSCKATTCKFGRLDSFAISEEMHHRFFEGYNDVALPHKFKMAVGGCPNNCMKPDLNDMGIVGQLIPTHDLDKCKGCKKCKIEQVCPMDACKVVDKKITRDTNICNNCGRCVGKCPFGVVDEGTPGYKLYIGGRWGKKISIGKPLTTIFKTQEEVLDVMEKAILLYKDQGIKGERFEETIKRIGFENIEEQLLDDDLLNRKDEILNKELALAK